MCGLHRVWLLLIMWWHGRRSGGELPPSAEELRALVVELLKANAGLRQVIAVWLGRTYVRLALCRPLLPVLGTAETATLGLANYGAR